MNLCVWFGGGESLILTFNRIFFPSFTHTSAEDLLLQVMLRNMGCVEVTRGTEQFKGEVSAGDKAQAGV